MVRLCMNDGKRLVVTFFQQDNGNEPVRDWITSLPDDDKRTVGFELQKVEFGWPIGMPLCRQIKGHKRLWEVRIRLTGGRIARVFFCTQDQEMILLHGFEKKSQKTPQKEIETAKKRLRRLRDEIK